MTSHRHDRGSALPIALILGLVILIVASAGIATGTAGLRAAHRNEHTHRAAAAAMAGLEDYRNWLRAGGEFWRQANPRSPFSADNTEFDDATSGMYPNTVNNAFQVDAGGRWGGDDDLQFRYEVDNSEVAADGILRVRVTGRSGDVTKTIIGRFTAAGFTDNLLTFDRLRSSIGAHDSGSGSLRDGEIAGANAMRAIDGPVHVNRGPLRSCATVFRGAVTTSSKIAGEPVWVEDPDTCSTTSRTGTEFLAPGDEDGPGFDPTLAFPATATKVLSSVRAMKAPGCRYTGPTRIVFNRGGSMTVRSPQSRSTSITGAEATACGAPGSGVGQLGSASGATVPVPDGGVVFVQDVPTAVGDANAASGADLPQTCFEDNHVGFPVTGEVDVRALVAETADPRFLDLVEETSPCMYGTRSGDLFLEGVLSGKLTVASQNVTVQTGDLTYDDAALDMLGVVTQNAYELWSPVSSLEPGKALAAPVRRTDAAILVTNGPVRAQHTIFGGSTDVSGPTTLTVTGSIASVSEAPLRSTIDFGGAVVNTGWQLDAAYDPRLRAETPPGFPTPAAKSMVLRQTAEVKPAFDASGAAR